MTQKLLDRIKSENISVYNHIMTLKISFKNGHVTIAKRQTQGYLLALQDLGFINENEKRLLYCYLTV